MALITCPECGAQISDQAPTCPKCGVPLPKVSKCPECGGIVSDQDLACPNCGLPLKQINPTAKTPTTGKTSGNASVEIPMWYKILSFVYVGLMITYSISIVNVGTFGFSFIFTIIECATLLMFIFKKEKIYFIVFSVSIIIDSLMDFVTFDDTAIGLGEMILGAILIVPILLKNSEGKSIYSSLK